MKLNKYILALPAAALAFAACDDYLDVTPANTLTTESFYQTPAQAEQGLNGVYHDILPASHHIYLLSECRSDNSYMESDTERDFSLIAWFDPNIVNMAEIDLAWTDYYKCIAHACTFLEQIDKINGFSKESIREQMKGEAYFLRAFSYFELVRYFGNIPVFDHTPSPNEGWSTPQSPASEVYKQIIADLEEAEKLLTDSPVDFRGNACQGKPTRTAAKAMLGRVYMTMAGFPLNDASKKDLAIAKFEEVLSAAGIAKGTKGTPTKYWAKDAKEWAGMFLHENDNKYFIWEIQYADNNVNATNNASNTGNTAVFEMQPFPTDYSFYPGRIFGNHIYVAHDIQKEYGHIYKAGENFGPTSNPDQDKRADWTVCYLDGSELVNAITGTGYNQNVQADGVGLYAFYTKFLETSPKRAAYGLEPLKLNSDSYGRDEINFPIIRLEDVMLMYCEAVGYNDYTLHLLNLIRERATKPVEAGEAAANWDNIVKRERRLELAQEGIRWHDMVRRGEINDYKTMLQYYNTEYAQIAIRNIDPKYYLYPIPQSQMTVKEGLYTQNPEYK